MNIGNFGIGQQHPCVDPGRLVVSRNLHRSVTLLESIGGPHDLLIKRLIKFTFDAGNVSKDIFTLVDPVNCNSRCRRRQSKQPQQQNHYHRKPPAFNPGV